MIRKRSYRLLVRNFTFKVSSQLLAAIMAFVSLLVMTRYVADEYGLMIWGLSLITLVNTLADLGFNTANLKFIAKEGYDRSDCFSTYMVIKAALTILMVGCTLVTVYLMRMSEAIDDEAVRVCLMFVLYQVISNVQFAIYYTLDGMMLSGKSSILTIVECGIRNAILILMALFYVDAETLSSAYVIATSISVVISVAMAWKVGLRLVRPTYIREYTIFALPLAAALILTAVVTNLDKVMVGLFYESIEVTYYSTAAGLIATFTAIGVSLNNVLLPHLSKNIADDRVTERMLWALERGLIVILGPFIVFFLVYGPEIAETLFGPQFGPSGQMIAILSIQIIPFVFAGMMTQVLYAINRGMAYLRASAILCAIAVSGFVVLIPNETVASFCAGLGGMGASFSISLAYVIYAVILIVMVGKYTRFRLYPRLWTMIIAFAGAIAVLYGLHELFDIHGLIKLALVGFLCEFVFIGILYAMKEVTKKDVRIVLKKLINDED